MEIIADVGGTRGRWVLVNKSDKKIVETDGFNPYIHKISHFNEIIRTLNKSLYLVDLQKISYYGAGINSSETKNLVKNSLRKFLKNTEISVFSDLLGSCRALCENQKGIVSILGTGSNSCFYDGDNILTQINSLGYLLGDEGSAFALGKKFIKMLIRNQLSIEIKEIFEGINENEKNYLAKIYGDNSRQWITNLSKFVYDHKNDSSLKSMIDQHFDHYFKEIILKYDYNKLFLSGSISFFYEKEIREVSNRYNIEIKKVVRDPIDHLVKYHVR